MTLRFAKNSFALRVRCCLWWSLAALLLPAATRAADSGAAAGIVIILEFAGEAEVLRGGEKSWNSAAINQVLKVGDRFRTKKRSRATLRLSDRSQLRVGNAVLKCRCSNSSDVAPVAVMIWTKLLAAN